jgi:PKD repeat protein
MFRIARAWPVAIIGLLFLAACSGGGGGPITTPGGFDLRITTDKTHGPAPLTVSFFVTPSGGTAPYTYAWDFNDDSVIDSNAPSGQFTFQTDTIARVTVTDSTGQSMSTSQSITITPITDPNNPNDPNNPKPISPLVVRLNATPQIGRVPFDVQFSPAVSGGRAPYQYAWDFDGNGSYEEFTQNPLHRYSQIGQKLGENHYGFFPVLKVTDSRGVTETNLQDLDENGQPDGQLEITTLTAEQTFIAVAFANPQAGQAPLTVEFTANVGGGSDNISYVWDFGDNQTSSPSTSSLISHTYQNAGTYIARVTAKDNDSGLSTQSAPITVTATEGQPFDLTISADVTAGQVPFVVNFEAHPVNGQEPIQYEWNVFDQDLNNPNPTPGNPGSLSGAAVVTPTFSQRKNPAIHFGNTAGDAGSHQYRVRVAATDALGSQKVSEFVVITAQPHAQPAPKGGNAYTAIHPLVVDRTFFGNQVGQDPITHNAGFGGDIQQDLSVIGLPRAWGARANAAVTSHISGVTFIIGGEHVGSNGSFQGLVQHGDANYAYVPTAVESADGGSQFGKYGTAESGLVQNGGLVQLNDGAGLAPAFPGNTVPSQGFNTGSSWDAPMPNPPGQFARADTIVPLWIDFQQDPATAGQLNPTSRSTLFNIVGSAAAVFMHEPPETNDEGLYPPPFTPIQPGTVDFFLMGASHYYYPDTPGTWNRDVLGGGPPGLGVPVIYVFGGRTGATTAVDTVQKYYPYGFGTEDMVPMSENFRFQTTNNQADIWSNYFLRPDRDQFPGSGTNFDGQIETRQPDQEFSMPHLPKSLYGLMAVRLQTGTDYPSPTFPQSGYSYVFVMGGIEGQNGGSGAVSDKMYWWDTTKGDEGEQDPVDGLFSEMPDMPTPRAYGQAVLITDLPLRIAVTGGFDADNHPLNTVDIFTFANQFNPTTGSWSSFTGTLDEALRSTSVGWNSGDGTGAFVLSFGGFAETDFTHNLYSYRLGGGGTVTESLPVVPRGWGRASQGGAAGSVFGPGQFTYNRYYLIGGATEQGSTNIIEVASLPQTN